MLTVPTLTDRSASLHQPANSQEWPAYARQGQGLGAGDKRGAISTPHCAVTDCPPAPSEKAQALVRQLSAKPLMTRAQTGENRMSGDQLLLPDP